MHVCVCVCGYELYKNPKINREGILIYGCVSVLRMVFKYTEIVCRKTHDVSANAYMDS